MKSIKARKQRKRLYNAPGHIKRNWISSHLEENLLLKYDKRAVSVVKGDTVRVMRGSFKGHEDKVVKVDVGRSYLEIEGITMSKADGNKIAKPIHPSNVKIVKLNLTDKWRRKKLERGLTEETRKEIEKEAEKQIKEEEKRKEEEAKVLEEEKEITEDKDEEPEKVEKPPEIDIKERKIPPKPKPKKEEIEKPKTKEETSPTKKPSEKAKKPTDKKTPKETKIKTSKEVEEKK